MHTNRYHLKQIFALSERFSSSNGLQFNVSGHNVVFDDVIYTNPGNPGNIVWGPSELIKTALIDVHQPVRLPCRTTPMSMTGTGFLENECGSRSSRSLPSKISTLVYIKESVTTIAIDEKKGTQAVAHL